MSRRLGLLFWIVAFGVGLGAQGPRPGPSARQRQAQFQRDGDLIDTLVEGAIDLSGEDDPLQRAARCNQLAHSLASSIRQAGKDRDAGRVAELGGHLRAMLAGGVAPNLTEARSLIAVGSVREQKLLKFSKVLRQMEHDLDQVPNTDPRAMQPALAAVRQGRVEVEKAIRGHTEK